MLNINKRGKNKMKTAITLTTMLVLLTSIALAETLPFEPYCYYTPEPQMTGWQESFDNANQIDYCQYNTSVFYIRSPVMTNFIGEYFTHSGTDLWTNNFLLTESGNIRKVEINIEYYEPSYNGVCLSQVLNTRAAPNTVYNSIHSVLLANHQNGFTPLTSFDDAYSQINDLGLPCDQWNLFQLEVSDFENDWGSSFTGRSKTIGTFGLEIQNVYVRNIELVGTEETLDIW